MLSVLNKRLSAAQMMPNYVALLFAVYDANLRQLIIANGGAPRPVLVRNREVTEIKIDGTPLGMFEDIEYDTLTLLLEPDDVLVFASDGILESTNDDAEQFGFERLSALLRDLPDGASADSISSAILNATDEFSGHPAEPHDDRTLVVLRSIAAAAPAKT